LNLYLLKNRNGLEVDDTTILASGTAEYDAAFIMAGRSINKACATMGAEKGLRRDCFRQGTAPLGCDAARGPEVIQRTS
jgi:hypothetical protein